MLEVTLPIIFLCAIFIALLGYSRLYWKDRFHVAEDNYRCASHERARLSELLRESDTRYTELRKLLLTLGGR